MVTHQEKGKLKQLESSIGQALSKNHELSSVDNTPASEEERRPAKRRPFRGVLIIIAVDLVTIAVGLVIIEAIEEEQTLKSLFKIY